MTTPNGSSFNISALSCPSTNAFLKVIAQPSSSGDLTNLQFSRDKDFDGTIDTVQHFPNAVSGICANGLISCDVGTWDNCVGYQWQVENDNLSLIENSLATLGGCYCINASCGDAGRTNRILSSIVSDLGSGAAAALAKHNPNYIISNAEVAGPLAKFYGQELSACQTENITNLTQYQLNPANLETKSNEYKTNVNGLYQTIANSSVASRSLTSLQTCQITRNTNYQNLTVNDIISYNSGAGGVHACSSPDCLELVLGTIGDDYWGGYCNIYRHNVSFYVHKPYRIQNAILKNARWDDWIRVSANHQTIYAHPYANWDGHSINGWQCEWGTNWNTSPNADFTSLIQQEGRVDFTVDIQVTGAGEGYAYAQVFVDTSCDLNQEWITNSCEAIANNNKCRLKTEIIDGVKTYQYYNRTGLTPIASERQIGNDNSCDLKITRPWWNATREYECQIEDDLDFTQGIARHASIQQSASTSTYTDLINGVSQQRGLYTPNITPPTNCTNACKLKRPKDKVQVAGTGPVATTEQEYDIIYQACTGPNQSICPLDENDTIIANCSCLNEFGTASTMMQSLRQAAQDLTCTTGNPSEF